MPLLRSVVKRHLFFFLFILFLLLLIFRIYRDYGIMWDEKVYVQVGRHYLIQIFNRFGIHNNLVENAPFIHGGIHNKTHGAIFDIALLLTSLPFRNFNFGFYHLVKALYSVMIFVLLYLIASKLLSRSYGLVSMVFLVLVPQFFTFMFVNSIDIPTTLFFTLAIWYFLYFIGSDQKIAKQLIFSFIMALIINERAVFWYLVPLNYIFIILFSLVKKKQNLFPTIKKLVIITIGTLTFMHFTHPYLFKHPIIGIWTIIDTARHGYPFTAAVLFDGTFYQAGVNPLPWYYLPKTMLITLPLLTLILFFIGNLRNLLFLKSLYHFFRPPHPAESAGAQAIVSKKVSSIFFIYLFCTFYIPFLLVFFLRPTLYDSWRQFLFLTVPIVIIATYGLEWLLNPKSQISITNNVQNTKSQKRNEIWKLVIGISLSFGLILTAQEMIILHPYEYLYYNSLAGGLKGAYGKYETDYLGLSYKEATEWFNKNENDAKKTYKILVEGDPLSSATYFKPNMHLTTNESEADYVFTFTRWNLQLKHPGKTIYILEKEGIPLIFIKQL